MAINTVAASVPGTAVKLADIPPGVGSVTLSVAAANTTVVYVGTTANVTTTGGGAGAAVVGGASVMIPMYAGSKGTTLYGIANVAGPTPVGIFISTSG